MCISKPQFQTLVPYLTNSLKYINSILHLFDNFLADIHGLKGLSTTLQKLKSSVPQGAWNTMCQGPVGNQMGYACRGKTANQSQVEKETFQDASRYSRTSDTPISVGDLVFDPILFYLWSQTGHLPSHTVLTSLSWNLNIVFQFLYLLPTHLKLNPYWHISLEPHNLIDGFVLVLFQFTRLLLAFTICLQLLIEEPFMRTEIFLTCAVLRRSEWSPQMYWLSITV